MQASNDNATGSRSIYPITQKILQADIGNHSLIQLQERTRDEPIPKLSSNSGDSMTPRLLLNSTKPKDYARNAREEEVCGGWVGVCVCVCVCVLFSTPFYL